MDRTQFEAELARDGYAALARSLEPNAENPEHAHGFDARLLVLEGAMTITCDGTARTYGPGETFAMPAGRRHAEQAGPAGVRYIAGRRGAAS